jgi:hypothetical protein
MKKVSVKGHIKKVSVKGHIKKGVRKGAHKKHVGGRRGWVGEGGLKRVCQLIFRGLG